MREISSFVEGAVAKTGLAPYWQEAPVSAEDVGDRKGILPVLVNQARHTADLMASAGRDTSIARVMSGVTISGDDDGSSLLGYQVDIDVDEAYPIFALLSDAIEMARQNSPEGRLDLATIDPPMPPEALAVLDRSAEAQPAPEPQGGSSAGVSEDTASADDAGVGG